MQGSRVDEKGEVDVAIHASELRETRWIPWVPAVLLLALTTACSIPLLRDPFNPPLRIGVAPNYPPVIFEQEGRILGIEADLAGLLSRDLGRPVEFVVLPFPELLDALAERKVDMLMGGLSVTHERSERIRFVSPYMEVGQLALIRSRDIARFGRIRGLRRGGTRVGYERGTSGERYVASSLPQAESFGFDDVEAGLRSLRADLSLIHI